jgi:GAF domain-containing protein
LCEQYCNTTFVSFAPEQGDLSSLTGRTTYHGWAELIAPAMARVLDRGVRTRQADPVDEAQRQLSLDALDLDGVPSDELQEIVTTARDLLGATGASVTILDREYQKTKAAVGMPSTTMARSASICDLTIGRAELLVVEDTMTDPRLAGTRWADGTVARFYAGYPVESPDGHRIGALCVIDREPHSFSDTDAALLRQLALRVQSVLWGNWVSR